MLLQQMDKKALQFTNFVCRCTSGLKKAICNETKVSKLKSGVPIFFIFYLGGKSASNYPQVEKSSVRGECHFHFGEVSKFTTF